MLLGTALGNTLALVDANKAAASGLTTALSASNPAAAIGIGSVHLVCESEASECGRSVRVSVYI